MQPPPQPPPPPPAPGLTGSTLPMRVTRASRRAGYSPGCTNRLHLGSRLRLAVCTAQARRRRMGWPASSSTYDTYVPRGTPSSPIVHSVPCATRSTMVRAVSALLGLLAAAPPPLPLLAAPLLAAAASTAAAAPTGSTCRRAARLPAAAPRCLWQLAAAWGACCRVLGTAQGRAVGTAATAAAMLGPESLSLRSREF